MKLKGIKPIEQHVEKIVIGLTGLVGLGLLGYQFFSPSTFKVGQKDVTVAETFDQAAENALRAKSGMDAAEPRFPAAPLLAKGDSGSMAVGMAARAGTDNLRISLTPAPAFGTNAADRTVAAAIFQLPVAAAPASVTAAAFRSTISPLEKLRQPALAKLLPAQQPFDKASISIEGLFSGAALREVLIADPDGDNGPLAPIPLGWWRDTANESLSMVRIIGVEVERETLRLPDGSTPPDAVLTRIDVMPGRTDGLKLWSESVKSLGDVSPLLDQLRAVEEDIERPAYLASIAGTEWKPPSELLAEADAEGQSNAKIVADLKRKLAEINTRIADIAQRAAAAPGTDPRAPGAQRDRGGPPSGGGGGGGKGAGTRPPIPTPTDRKEPTLSKAALERQLAARQQERARIVARLEKLGESAGDEPVAAAATIAPPSLLENPEVKLFAHDLTVEPGAEYRYRMRVALNNPLYGRNLQESQRTLADQPLIRGEWSTWSMPTAVDPDQLFFITSAEQRSDISPMPKASAEMFVFYYGYYRSATASLEPGDALRGTAKLPELKLADMQKLEQMVKDGTLPPPSADAPLAPPSSPREDREGRPGGRGRAPNDARPSDGERAGSPMQPSSPDNAAAASWLDQAAKQTLDLKVDALFLDATPVAVGQQGLAGEDRTRFQALLQNRFGRITMHQPDIERATQAYKRVEASAKLGERQGAPEIKPETQRPGLDRRRPDAPARTAPSGVGGG